MRLFIVALLALLPFTSLNAETFYTTDATYTPGPEPGTYLMKVIIKMITATRGMEKEELIAAPSVKARLGQPARIELLGGKRGKDVTVSSFYPAENENRAITCSVELKEKGKLTYRTKLSVALALLN